jgi:hypothetical protein
MIFACLKRYSNEIVIKLCLESFDSSNLTYFHLERRKISIQLPVFNISPVVSQKVCHIPAEQNSRKK